MKVKLEWWGSTFTPENDQDKQILKSLVESVNEVEGYVTYWPGSECIYWDGDSLVVNREGGG